MLWEAAVRAVFLVNATVLSLGDRRLMVVVRKFFEFVDHFFKNLNRSMLNMIMITDGNQNENTICVIVCISSMSRSKVDMHIIIFLFSTTTIDRVLGRPKQIATHHMLAINMSMSLNFDLSLSILVFLSKIINTWASFASYSTRQFTCRNHSNHKNVEVIHVKRMALGIWFRLVHSQI